MNNKLLIGTALSSVIALSGSAFAELKVSGDVEATHRGISYDKTGAAFDQDNDNGIGFESNIILTYTKDLDNGLGLKAGSILEDGTADSEYITIGGDSVSFTVGQDVGNNLSSTVVPHISDQTGTLVGRPGSAPGSAGVVGTAMLYDNQFAANDEAHSAAHMSIDAKAAGGTFTVRYAPNNSEVKASDSEIISTAGKGSATEILYSGSLGVEGLGVQLGRQTETEGDESVAGQDDATLDKLGISYNFGQFAVGAQTQRFDDGTASDSDTKSKTVAATFSANDQLSIGLRYHETDKDGSSYTADEEITVLEVGYNFGGLGVELAYADIENVGGVSANKDAEVFQIRTRAKF
jgi:hypothetical protein